MPTTENGIGLPSDSFKRAASPKQRAHQITAATVPSGIEMSTVVPNVMTAKSPTNAVWPTPAAARGKRKISASSSSSSAPDDDGNGPMRFVAALQSRVYALVAANSTRIQWTLCALMLVAYHIYLIFAIRHDFKKALTVVAATALGWLSAIYYRIVVPLCCGRFKDEFDLIVEYPRRFFKNMLVKICIALLIAGFIAVFLFLDTAGTRHRLIGLAGIVFFFLFMFSFSQSPSKVKWRPVILGFLLQFSIGLFVLRWDSGAFVFEKFSNATLDFLNFSRNGTDFIYGFLSRPPNICGMEPVFAFQPIQVVVYFGSVVALLYYTGVMQWILRRMAWIVQATLGTTATESLNACACIFLGQSEAPLLIRPYLEHMTASELHAVMTTGFSCIAGTVFATYISLGACPQYLLSATLMSAPGSLACSKLLFPETERSQLVDVEDLELPEQKESSALESISNGAVMAAELVIAIVANLIVFLALLAFLDAVIGYFGSLAGYTDWSFEYLLGFAFYPLAYIMGVTESSEETFLVAQLMGTKTALNEFIAYRKLGLLVRENRLKERSAMIAAFALCGFSNFSSIGIQLGILGGMAPSRKQLLSKLVLRALLAGSVSCFMTASMAGVLVSDLRKCLPHVNEDCFDLSVALNFLKNVTEGGASRVNITTTTVATIAGALNREL